jgi:AraC-like DNA-binding protein
VFYFGHLAGDTDGDADVDFNDAWTLMGSYKDGASDHTPIDGDFTADGVVDEADSASLKANYGQTLTMFTAPEPAPTAIPDPDVAFAMRYIRDHACEGMTVDQLVDRLSISRRSLERRFREHLGRTLHEEMLRVQMDHAKLLLRETELLVPAVAERCGYRDRRRFSKTFQKSTGQNPAEFRRHARR